MPRAGRRSATSGPPASGAPATNPDHYRPIFENAHVRVLEYTDLPCDVTTPHDHPDSLMYTVSSFRRRLVADGAASLEAAPLGPS